MNDNKSLAALIHAAVSIFKSSNSNTETAGQFKGTHQISTDPKSQLEGCLVFDAKLDFPTIFICLKTTESKTGMRSNMISFKTVIGVSDAIKLFENALLALDCKNLENKESCFDFLEFIGKCNKFIATFHNLDFNTPAYNFDRIWCDKGMDSAFCDINQSASDNFVIPWLMDFDSTMSRQIAEAGHHESVDLLTHLQGDFIEKLVGFDGTKPTSDGSLSSTLVKKYGKDKAINILTNLLRSI